MPSRADETRHAGAAEPAKAADVAEDLRVLVVHNRYRAALPSGENNVVDREIALLREAGVMVATHIRSSDEIDEMGVTARVALPLRAVWSPADTAAVAAIVERERPQVLHLHNPYPLVSPAVIRTAKRRGVAVVQSVHNYRHSCLNGLHLRDGGVCTLCVGRRFAWPGVRHGCYRDSVAQGAALATAELVHRGSWASVDRFLVLGEFMAAQLEAAGVERSRIAVKPNFVDDPGPPAPLGEGFFFAGRLEEAKGVRLLLDAWQASGLDGTVPLVVAGDGPLRREVEVLAGSMRSVEVPGRLDPDAMAEQFRACAAVVAPSLCFEGLPGVVVEALAHGRPVVATNMGALVDAVSDEHGWLTDPDVEALAATLRQAWQPDPARSQRARTEYERRFTAERVRDALLDQYRGLLR